MVTNLLIEGTEQRNEQSFLKIVLGELSARVIEVLVSRG